MSERVVTALVRSLDESQPEAEPVSIEVIDEESLVLEGAGVEIIFDRTEFDHAYEEAQDGRA